MPLWKIQSGRVVENPEQSGGKSEWRRNSEWLLSVEDSSCRYVLNENINFYSTPVYVASILLSHAILTIRQMYFGWHIPPITSDTFIQLRRILAIRHQITRVHSFYTCRKNQFNNLPFFL
ncbi:hypothetical protein CEXT_612471 [Caerostris extrusa]|uniref:Uncharacterized protein n=1 Tax=Caerostris extrusa TaxID=172846 RepID=A0AAV4XI87_CAEEX|nr:hypothetical protein CEXT_612471 [Caerostris extrusa]